MTRQLISSGSQFEHDIGYSRAVVDGEWVFVSGTTGFDYSTMTISDSLPTQTEAVLEEHTGRPAAGGRRVRGRRAGDLRAAQRRALSRMLAHPAQVPAGHVRPAAIDDFRRTVRSPECKIEIEVTARRHSK